MLTASTATVHGHYDFFTGLITLDKFDVTDLPTIVLALATTPPPVINDQTIKLREIRALIKHEVTHFLDHATTNWGLEFLARRCRLVKSIEKGGDPTQPLQVYLLNAAELQMHRDLVQTHKPRSLALCDTVQHSLRYEKRHGAIIIVQFLFENELVHSVPLSMLSLLEANAIANEYLSRLDDLKGMCTQSRAIAAATVERKLEKVLSEPELSEYSVIISLAKLHFSYLDITQLLRFVSALANFCLNASTLALGTISELIRRSFNNVGVGTAIWADLCRGMSRHIIAFKTIIFMHGWILECGEDKRHYLVEEMKTDPNRVIQQFWSEAGMQDLLGVSFEKNAALEIIKDCGAMDEFNIASKVLKNNKKWSNSKNLEDCNFNEIVGLDVLLGDDTVAPLPNRINFDVLNYSYAIAETYNKAEKLTGDAIEKFHMPPEHALAMLAMAVQKGNN